MAIINLQFFGGRGSSSGESLAEQSTGANFTVLSEVDVWSFRHQQGNEPFVDAMNSSVRDMANDFPTLMNDIEYINAATLKGAAASQVLGYYGDGNVSLNANYTNVQKMNDVYDAAVQSGFHPSRGNKSGTEAVTYHEMGHALTDSIKNKVGAEDLNASSKKIVNDAYKASGGTGGTKKWAGGISGYAQDSFAECVAEAVADWYCNGSNSSKQSKAIMTELFKYK